MLLERAYTKLNRIGSGATETKYHDVVYDLLRHSIDIVVIATNVFSDKKRKNSAGIRSKRIRKEKNKKGQKNREKETKGKIKRKRKNEIKGLFITELFQMSILYAMTLANHYPCLNIDTIHIKRK